ncbi:MAG: hypothetical protein E6J00_14735, partial [Chloroflexi bacterium]
AAAEREVAELAQRIAALQAKIADTRLQLARLKSEYGGFLRASYKSDADPMAQMLAAPSFQAFLNRAVAIEHLTFLSKQLMVRIKQTELDLQAQQTVLQMDKKTADRKRDDLVAQKQQLVQQQAKEQVLEAKLRASISQVKWELKAINGQSAALAQRIADMDLQLARLKSEYGGFLRASYKSDADPMAQMLAAPSFQAFLNRAVAIEHLTFLSKQLMVRIKQTELDLQAQQTVLQMDKKTADRKRDDLVAQKQQLVQQQAKEQVLEAKLRASISQVKWELKAINGQSAALAQRIADMEIARQDELIAEAEQAAWQQAQFWMQNNLFIIPTASGTHSTKYPLVWPLQQGTITQLFGPSTLVFEPPGFGYAHFHTGVDISFTQGTPILAADDGIVVAAASSTMNGQLVGYGNYVILAHRNNFFSLYGHLLGFTVKAGDTVHQGQPIGAEGSTGNSTGPHVHFEYR